VLIFNFQGTLNFSPDSGCLAVTRLTHELG
jgi:hypothetical protein